MPVQVYRRQEKEAVDDTASGIVGSNLPRNPDNSSEILQADEEPSYITVDSTNIPVKAYANGSGSCVTDGEGGIRSQIFGTREYGSGYPNNTGRGVASRESPFCFWPIVWPAGLDGIPEGKDTEYLYSGKEQYGTPEDERRPGGPLTTAVFTPLNSTSNTTTFRIISDNTTVSSLIGNIYHNCSTYLDPTSGAQRPVPFDLVLPLSTPGQAVQYYRASSIVMVLDGYNNTAAFAPEGTAPDSPLPLGLNLALMACLNTTIGAAAPLELGPPSFSHMNTTRLLGDASTPDWVYGDQDTGDSDANWGGEYGLYGGVAGLVLFVIFTVIGLCWFNRAGKKMDKEFNSWGRAHGFHDDPWLRSQRQNRKKNWFGF